MKKNKLQKEYKDKTLAMYFKIAIIGSIICFVGDMLLGCFNPSDSKGMAKFFPAFSEEWSEVNAIRFVFGGICGVVALLLIFWGFFAIYLLMEKWNTLYRKIFLISSFVFVAVGTLYHCVFAITAWLYNRLTNYNVICAKQISEEFFFTFIFVSALAAVGFAMLSFVMFIAAIKGVWSTAKWFIWVNPILVMMLSIVLVKLLPQNAVLTGIFDWGQQSISLFVVFFIFKKMYLSKGIAKKENYF